MSVRRRAVDGGELVFEAAEAGRPPAPGLDAVLELAEGLLGEPRSFVRRLELQGHALWCKGGPLRGHARRRHALRRLVLRQRLPRQQELCNLRWLRERLFRAPEPLAAARVERFGIATFQLLVTREVPGARPLDDAWPALEPGVRPSVLAELARELARLHALHFVHRDLFCRNVLVTEPEAGRRLVFADAWRGGPGLSWRGPSYDLAALFLDGATLFDEDEARAFLATYVHERERQDAPLSVERFLRAVERERAGLVRVVERDPARARGRGIATSWTAPAIR